MGASADVGLSRGVSGSLGGVATDVEETTELGVEGDVDKLVFGVRVGITEDGDVSTVGEVSRLLGVTAGGGVKPPLVEVGNVPELLDVDAPGVD